jgi:hypothetical protein
MVEEGESGGMAMSSYKIYKEKVLLNPEVKAEYDKLQPDISSIENGTRKPVAMGALTKEEIDAEISKGIKSIEEGRVYLADAVEAEMMRDFGI